MEKQKAEKTKPIPNFFSLELKKQIEEAAYYKWLNRGRQGGDSTEDWLEAELELQSNLYSEDDDVERSLASSVPKKTSIVSLESNRRDSIAAAESEKVVGAKKLDSISAIDQLTIARQQDKS